MTLKCCVKCIMFSKIFVIQKFRIRREECSRLGWLPCVKSAFFYVRCRLKVLLHERVELSMRLYINTEILGSQSCHIQLDMFI